MVRYVVLAVLSLVGLFVREFGLGWAYLRVWGWLSPGVGWVELGIFWLLWG